MGRTRKVALPVAALWLGGQGVWAGTCSYSSVLQCITATAGSSLGVQEDEQGSASY